MDFCFDSEEQLLDLVHAAIKISQDAPTSSLESLLNYGGSAWSASETGLQRRVHPIAQVEYSIATMSRDPASDELKQAASTTGR